MINGTLATTIAAAASNACGHLPLHKTPLLWSFLLQSFCSIVICSVAHHTYRRVKHQYMARVIELNGQLKRMEARLRMQQPNISLISQIARKMRMPLDEEAGEKTRVNHLVTEGSALISPSHDHPPRDITLPIPVVATVADPFLLQLEPEETQHSSLRKVKSKSSSRPLKKAIAI